MKLWRDMAPAERNHFMGELMQAPRLTQCYLAVDGRRVLVTPYTEGERGKVDAMLAALRASDDLWAEFLRANSHAAADWRGKLAVDVERWHMRYSDTPGGAWCVVEWLREQKFQINIRCVWDNSAESHYNAWAYSNWAGEFVATAKAMPDAVCELLLRVKAPEVLA